MTHEIAIGNWLVKTEGVYEIIGFKEKGNTFCTVREVIFDDDNADDYHLGDTLYFTKEEVKNCLHFMLGYSVEPKILER